MSPKKSLIKMKYNQDKRFQNFEIPLKKVVSQRVFEKQLEYPLNIEEDIKFNYNFKEFKNHLDIKKSIKKRVNRID